MSITQDHTYQAQEKLTTLLEQQGYTRDRFTMIFTSEVIFHPNYCGYTYNCKKQKPIRIFHDLEKRTLTIVQPDCDHHKGLEHEPEFLQELIPVLGKLDAIAVLDPGNIGKGPRLIIHL